MIRLIDVHKTFKQGASDITALSGVSAQIPKGQFAVIMGPSGSGKSTLLHLLGGLVEPSEGTVEWSGQPLASLDAAARGELRAHSIAYVFQGANLLPHFTAYENVSFAAHVSAGEAKPELTAPALLELVGLTPKADHLPAELSGGEAQRVAIARALAGSPELVLCDEPTGHLDSDTGERVLDLIEAIQREFGFALVVATHDPEVAARQHRSVELQDGRIVSQEAAA